MDTKGMRPDSVARARSDFRSACKRMADYLDEIGAGGSAVRLVGFAETMTKERLTTYGGDVDRSSDDYLIGALAARSIDPRLRFE